MGYTIKDLPNSGDYLKAGDFPADLNENLTIDTVELKTFDDGAKFLLTFVELGDYENKVLVLNKTNAKVLFTNLHANTDAWVGSTITLRTTPTQKGQGFAVIVPTAAVAAPTPGSTPEANPEEWDT